MNERYFPSRQIQKTCGFLRFCSKERREKSSLPDLSKRELVGSALYGDSQIFNGSIWYKLIISDRDAILPSQQEAQTNDPTSPIATPSTSKLRVVNTDFPSPHISNTFLDVPQSTSPSSTTRTEPSYHANRSLPPTPGDTNQSSLYPIVTQASFLNIPRPNSPDSPSIYPSTQAVSRSSSFRSNKSTSMANLGQLSVVTQRLAQIEQSSRPSTPGLMSPSSSSRSSRQTPSRLTTPIEQTGLRTLDTVPPGKQFGNSSRPSTPGLTSPSTSSRSSRRTPSHLTTPMSERSRSRAHTLNTVPQIQPNVNGSPGLTSPSPSRYSYSRSGTPTSQRGFYNIEKMQYTGSNTGDSIVDAYGGYDTNVTEYDGKLSATPTPTFAPIPTFTPTPFNLTSTPKDKRIDVPLRRTSALKMVSPIMTPVPIRTPGSKAVDVSPRRKLVREIVSPIMMSSVRSHTSKNEPMYVCFFEPSTCRRCRPPEQDSSSSPDPRG